MINLSRVLAVYSTEGTSELAKIVPLPGIAAVEAMTEERCGRVAMGGAADRDENVKKPSLAAAAMRRLCGGSEEMRELDS
jgi:hypothetical protein